MGTLHDLRDDHPDAVPDDRGADVAFAFVLLVLWVFSVGRVALALASHEVFGAEAGLAFLCMLALPFAAIAGIRHGRKPPPRPSADRQSAVVVAFRPRG